MAFIHCNNDATVLSLEQEWPKHSESLTQLRKMLNRIRDREAKNFLDVWGGADNNFYQFSTEIFARQIVGSCHGLLAISLVDITVHAIDCTWLLSIPSSNPTNWRIKILQILLNWFRMSQWPVSSHQFFFVKMMFLNIIQKVTEYLGHFSKGICCPVH